MQMKTTHKIFLINAAIATSFVAGVAGASAADCRTTGCSSTPSTPVCSNNYGGPIIATDPYRCTDTLTANFRTPTGGSATPTDPCGGTIMPGTAGTPFMCPSVVLADNSIEGGGICVRDAQCKYGRKCVGNAGACTATCQGQAVMQGYTGYNPAATTCNQPGSGTHWVGTGAMIGTSPADAVPMPGEYCAPNASTPSTMPGMPGANVLQVFWNFLTHRK